MLVLRLKHSQTRGPYEPFYATWSAYAFFIGGLLQLLVGILEVFRNNVYGATAFMAFGSFWLANGIQMLIRAYFPEEIPDMCAAARKLTVPAPRHRRDVVPRLLDGEDVTG